MIPGGKHNPEKKMSDAPSWEEVDVEGLDPFDSLRPGMSDLEFVPPAPLEEDTETTQKESMQCLTCEFVAPAPLVEDTETT